MNQAVKQSVVPSQATQPARDAFVLAQVKWFDEVTGAFELRERLFEVLPAARHENHARSQPAKQNCGFPANPRRCPGHENGATTHV